MRFRAAVVAATAALTLPAAAQAEEACPAPSVTAFVLPPDAPRADSAARISVNASATANVEVQWPEGDVSSKATRRDTVVFERVFARPGSKRILATAVAPCGTRSAPVALRFTVRPPCRDTRDASVYDAACDDALSDLRVGAAGVWTSANRLTSGCRDVIPSPRIVRVGGDEPTARAAACTDRPGPPRVPGRVPVKRGGRLDLTFGVPVSRVQVRLGGPDRGTVRLTGVRGAGRRFSVRIPRTASTAHSRVWIGARQGGWVAGIRLLAAQ